mmetsp:Transcript_31705/g.46439  ORF Transcript_31705/g.46439 Transcript_31705/m.46439 type:complete len:206 (+) Transcript_31705:124-741(+)
MLACFKLIFAVVGGGAQSSFCRGAPPPPPRCAAAAAAAGACCCRCSSSFGAAKTLGTSRVLVARAAAIPTYSAGRYIRLTFGYPAATRSMAGPGQIPQSPQPMPKSQAPRMRGRSRAVFLGMPKVQPSKEPRLTWVDREAFVTTCFTEELGDKGMFVFTSSSVITLFFSSSTRRLQSSGLSSELRMRRKAMKQMTTAKPRMNRRL